MLSNRKHPRLKNGQIYKDESNIVHIICHYKCDNNTLENTSNHMLNMIKIISLEKDITVYAFSIMPNHIHLLISQTAEFGIFEFVKTFKGRLSVIFRKNNLSVSFQKSFYDHVVREDEDLLIIAKYIIKNPLRGGIAECIGEHRFSGSLYFNIEDFFGGV